jgi:predicted transcriptional regulator
VGLSQIMERTNLTTGQTKHYVVYLIDKGLIRMEMSENQSRCLYKTTQKGMEYLMMANSIIDLVRT